jgi:glycosyltransferase involved in cell wall biosynthesis
MDLPAVSIVVAAYNRSNVLELAIASAVAQTFTDWEMLVVGDACTDDSEQVVRAFGDPRIDWENLPVNHGDQSGPSNHGVGRARGRYVAFLNQDDLWFPDHLERSVATLERSPGAGGVYSPVCFVDPADGTSSLTPSWTGRYETTRVIAPATGWLMRRETIDRVGPWRARHECHEAPSRDWMTRATRAGVTFAQVPHLTVLALPSGARAGSYRNRDDSEQRRLWERMQADPGMREALLTDIAMSASAELIRPRPLGHARQAVRDGVVKAFGSRWIPVKTALRYRRKGGLVDDLRRIRGLPPHEHAP